VDTCVNEFLEFLSVEKGASGNTVAAYRNDLGQLEEYLDGKRNGRASPISWPAVGQDIVVEYILHLKSQTYADATVARKVAAVKSFFAFLQAEGKLKVNPTETLASPKVGKSLPKPLTVQEIDELLEQPARRNTPEARRDRAMLELMYATGLRVTELVSLDLGDVQALPHPDDTFDVAAATFVFCSVPDPVLGFRELRRVVRPGGAVVLMEHVRSDNPAIGRVMDLLNPLVVRVMGANINRQTVTNIGKAGLLLERVEDLGAGGIFKLVLARVPEGD